ncbi:MAG: class I SAM-dependent methyltransferase [Deltaproteobacteria bacterium]|nr:class I SAM-dependent methyltransferase [Deltaproteobacteria bacterium]MBI3389648.1 class I SAM-dependent methyltransferase [Deltaproteobacteria bacterium]
MATLEFSGPNAQQIQYWNEQAGPKWVALHDFINAQIEPLGRAAMDRARVTAGERVLDVGCGCGHTTLELARRVGPTGSALGVDISTTMLDRARADARAAGLHNAQFEEADAQTHALPRAHFDLVFSRFGVMFFSDPTAAFANLQSALRPGGRVAFVCWQALPENPWMFVPLMAAAQYIQLPAPPEPGAPGPFAFADAERVRGILTGAGFVDVAIDPHNEVLAIGAGLDLDRTVDFLLQMGPTGNALRQAAGEVNLAAVSAAIAEALRAYQTPQGVRMPSAAWIVTARK